MSDTDKLVAKVRDELVDKINEKTELMEEQLSGKKKVEMSDKAKKIAKLIETANPVGNCSSNASLFQLVSLIIDEPVVPTNATTVSLIKGAAIKVSKNPNSHDYPLDETIIVTDSTQNFAMMQDGVVGNHLPSADKKTYSTASKDEIKRFLSELGTAELLQLATVLK